MSYKNLTKHIGLLRKLQNLIPTKTLITIYAASVRLHIDYGDDDDADDDNDNDYYYYYYYYYLYY